MDSVRDLLRPAALQSDDLTILEADLENAHHAKAIVSLLDSYAREPAGIGAPLRDSVKQRLIPALRAQPGALVLLAILRKQPVGIAVCLRSFSTFAAAPVLNLHDLAVLRSFSTFAAAPVLNLHDLAVLRSHRGLKIGRELLRVVETKARALGCVKMTLEARENNERALHLYESAGFSGRKSRSGAPRTLFLEKSFRQDAVATPARGRRRPDAAAPPQRSRPNPGSPANPPPTQRGQPQPPGARRSPSPRPPALPEPSQERAGPRTPPPPANRRTEQPAQPPANRNRSAPHTPPPPAIRREPLDPSRQSAKPARSQPHPPHPRGNPTNPRPDRETNPANRGLPPRRRPRS